MAMPRLEEYPDNPGYIRNIIFAGTAMARLCLLEKNDMETARELYERFWALAAENKESERYNTFLLSCLRVWISCFRDDAEEKKTQIEEFKRLLVKRRVFDDIAMEAHGVVRLLMRTGDNESAFDIVKLILDSVDRLALGMQICFLQCEVEILKQLERKEESMAAAYRFFEAYVRSERENAEARVFSANIRIEVEKNRKENQLLVLRAETDELTGLPNRYHMNEHAETIFKRAWEKETSLAVELLDIDYFKQINDTFGHLEGDRYLRAVADELRRMSDQNRAIYCARYGGDEFVILYENMTDEEVLAYARGLKARVEKLALPNPGSKVREIVTVSQGIRNSVPSRSNRLWDYLSTADTAMYRVKKNNRGEILLVHYRGDPEIN